MRTKTKNFMSNTWLFDQLSAAKNNAIIGIMHCIFSMYFLPISLRLDWIEQGLTSPPTQYRLSGRQFHRWKDPTNSIKVLKEKFGQPQTGRGSKPTRGLPPCYMWTSEKKPYHLAQSGISG